MALLTASAALAWCLARPCARRAWTILPGFHQVNDSMRDRGFLKTAENLRKIRKPLDFFLPWIIA